MLRRKHGSALAFFAALATALSAAGAAWAYHTNFTGAYCNYNPPQYTNYFTRDGSMEVALRARYEGYQYGGGHFSKSTLTRDCRACAVLS